MRDDEQTTLLRSPGIQDAFLQATFAPVADLGSDACDDMSRINV